MIEINPLQVPHTQVQRILQGAVGPRPIALASTIDREGRPNLSPFSFFNVFGVNPTTLIFSPSRRGRDNTVKNTYENVKEVPEVVINMVTYDMVQQVSLSSTEYPKGVNEFEKVGFHQAKSLTVKPWRVLESPVQFECKVRQVIETGDQGGAANLIICEITMIHIHEEILGKDGSVDPDKIRLVGRLGGDFYVKAFSEALFKVKKPLDTLGIGVDSLPDSVRFSKVLTGNHLGQLGNLERLPDQPDRDELLKLESVSQTFREDLPLSQTVQRLHKIAAEMIEEGEVMTALTVLLMADTLINGT